jgi:hypothetical protein
MKLRSKSYAGLRLAPLAAALVAAVGTVVDATAAQLAQAPFSVAMPPSWRPGDGSGVAALMQALRAKSAHRGPVPSGATTRIVTSCEDDTGSGTLRATIAAANSRDIIELGSLQCSAITLAQGAIPVKVDDLTVHGRDAQALAIDAEGTDRVFADYGYGTLTLDHVTVRNGINQLAGYKVAGGACIIANGYVTLDHSVVSGCRSIGEGAYGGAILSRGVTLHTSSLVNNVAQGSLLSTLTAAYGGAAFAYRGTVLMYSSVVSGNRATIDPANRYGGYDTGGGIFVDNGGVAVASTIAGNYTDGTGGGIASHAGFVISNSTISGNVAKSKTGGGLFVIPVNPVLISNSTITGNQASSGGGLYLSGNAEAVTLQSTIVAGNSASAGAADIDAPAPQTVYGANNLIGAAASVVTVPSDTLRSAPRLLPLSDNGGPTQTHALDAGSPAINRGNNVANFATDQRGAGYPRVRGTAADIGAFESAPAAVGVPEAAPALSPGMLGLLAATFGLLGWHRSKARQT